MGESAVCIPTHSTKFMQFQQKTSLVFVLNAENPKIGLRDCRNRVILWLS